MVLDEHILSSGCFSLSFCSQSGLVFDSQQLSEAAAMSDTNATTQRTTQLGVTQSVL